MKGTRWSSAVSLLCLALPLTHVFLDVDPERSTQCRFIGYLHVSLPHSRGRKASSLRRYRWLQIKTFIRRLLRCLYPCPKHQQAISSNKPISLQNFNTVTAISSSRIYSFWSSDRIGIVCTFNLHIFQHTHIDIVVSVYVCAWVCTDNIILCVCAPVWIFVHMCVHRSRMDVAK